MKKHSGATLLEAVVASSITVLVLGTTTTVWLAGAKSWYRGAGKIQAETQSRRAVRTVCNELSEAMSVTVDADGMGMTFQKPAKDASGDYVCDVQGQPVSDGFNRRIYFQSGKLRYLTPTGTRLLSFNVITTDPNSPGGTTPYKIFVAGAGKITRQVTVMVATQTTGANREIVKGRNREVAFLRNIYDTTR
ncbi:MAG: hypothetical protein JSS66_13365 [Armatimonadetes bacterium]|nr:hypothetical protein [Armatimonadota bacterium]